MLRTWRNGWPEFAGASCYGIRASSGAAKLAFGNEPAMADTFNVATQTIPTTCPMDCPDTCALEVDVQDGKLAAIRGAADHPVTQGFICSKIADFGKRVYHESRLHFPMRRTGAKGSGQFARISWDEAIAEITAQFRAVKEKWGGEAILPYHYGGSNGYLGDSLLDDYFFARLGASRLALTICAAPTGEVALGMYGKMPGVAFEDYPLAKFILIWGANPKASNIHLVPFLREAKKNGAFVATVDPRNNFSSDQVDLHLPVYPGADLPLALAMIRLWNDRGLLATEFLRAHADGLETLLAAAKEWPLDRAAQAARVSGADIERLAMKYAESSPALLRCGWGLERNCNGGPAVAAVLAMPALLGKFGVPGGGYTLSNSAAMKLEKQNVLGPFEWTTRQMNMTQLGAVLGPATQPPVKALFVYNANPAATTPDQEAVLRGLSREDLFTVVFDQVMTDTAMHADILLPATTFVEQREVRRGYGNYLIGGIRPAIARVGESRPNEEVFAMLGRAMGWKDAPFTWDSETYVKKVAAAVDMNGRPGTNATALLEGKYERPDFSGPRPVQFKTVFPRTPDRKIHFTPAALGPKPFHFESVRSEKFPLALISPASSKLISSMMGEFNVQELRLTLHPADAAARGICDGDTVRAFNDLGEVICRARLSPHTREGVAAMPKGAWRKSSLNGRTSTALSPATIQTVGSGACFNDARIEVARM